MDFAANPFSQSDIDRYEIWELLVRRDFEGFLKGDWSLLKDDFIEDEFFGIDCQFSENPDLWQFSFPDLQSYQNEWEKQSSDFRGKEFAEDPRLALYRAVSLRNIFIDNNKGSVHKYFDGSIAVKGEADIRLNWVSIFLIKKVQDIWKVKGFTGYIKNTAL